MQKKNTPITYSQAKKQVASFAKKGGFKLGKFSSKKVFKASYNEFEMLQERVAYDMKVRDVMVKISAAMHSRMPKGGNKSTLEDVYKFIATFGPGFDGRPRITAKDVKEVAQWTLNDILVHLFR